jgi:hypothetical protein
MRIREIEKMSSIRFMIDMTWSTHNRHDMIDWFLWAITAERHLFDRKIKAFVCLDIILISFVTLTILFGNECFSNFFMNKCLFCAYFWAHLGTLKEIFMNALQTCRRLIKLTPFADIANYTTAKGIQSIKSLILRFVIRTIFRLTVIKNCSL